MNQKINWDNLKSAVQRNECILIIGPNIATFEKEGQMVSIRQLLVEHLVKELKKINPDISLIPGYNLSFVARKLEDSLMPKMNFSAEKVRSYLGEIIQSFYKNYSHSDFEVYRNIAQLPFRFIVDVNPDNFLSQAYDDENKFATINEFYHYKNPLHNNKVFIEEDSLSVDAPLVYNLFGSIESPDSMIITESDRLAFLDAVLQREKNATIPPSVAIHFTSHVQSGEKKTFLFLGFDFNQWHLKLIMHLINRFQSNIETIALQNPQDLSELNSFFYQRNFEVQFVDLNPLGFTEQFKKQLNNKKQPSEANSKLKVFLMFDPEDSDERHRLDLQLAPLRRADYIETWDEQEMIAGDEVEATIRKQIEQADIILPLITPRFFSSDKIYLEQLQLALARHDRKETVVIPILMKSSYWENSLIGKLTTILPRNKTPLNEQVNSDASLSDIIKQLERFCDKIYKRKKQNNR